MNEEFLYFVWEKRLYNVLNLRSSSGQLLQVISPGRRNNSSGPDFYGALLKIDQQLFSGDIEIHVRSSDWYLHKHHQDKSYNAVILHVVHQHNREVKNELNQPVVTLELSHLIEEDILSNLKHHRKYVSAIPCGSQVKGINDKADWIKQLALFRLAEKIKEIKNEMNLLQGDLREVFYRFFLKNYGLQSNSLPFYLLAGKLPLKLMMRYSDNLIQQKALLLGASGLLSDHISVPDGIQMKSEFNFLSRKHHISPLSTSVWNRGKTRPKNDPVLRICQLNLVLPDFPKLFDLIFLPYDFKIIYHQYKLFFQISCCDKNNGKAAIKGSGSNFISLFWINQMLPFLFWVRTVKGSDSLQEDYLDCMRNIPAEKNHITKNFQNKGVLIKNALQSQAVLHLKRQYCDKKKCLQCSLGLSILETDV